MRVIIDFLAAAAICFTTGDIRSYLRVLALYYKKVTTNLKKIHNFRLVNHRLKHSIPLPFFLVQSLNSPFFLPHIGAESGRVKRESRITCMRMLRTNQSKITRFQPYYAARVNESRNAFFSSRSEKKHFL